MPSSKLCESLAAKISKEVSANPYKILPPLRSLAARYQVSYVTVWKALQILKGKGLVQTAARAGSGAASPGGKNVSISAINRFYESVKTRIVDGTFTVGQRLPKNSCFTLSERVSFSTLLSAFERLAAQGLLHKQGRHWIAGPASTALRSKGSAATAIRTKVLMLVLRSADWRTLFANYHMSSFMLPLKKELEQAGIDLLPVMHREAMTSKVDVPTGFRDVYEHIDELGSTCRGILIHMQSPDQRWLCNEIRHLLGRHRPVVYFDSTNEGAAVTRAAAGVGTGYFRMHFDERAAVRQSLTGLAAWGHRRIGVHATGLRAWTSQRTALIKECAAELSTPIEVIDVPTCEKHWSLTPDSGFSERIRSIVGESVCATTDATHARIREMGQSIASLLSQGATALVALNDALALQYREWLIALGATLPRDLSIVSFDNEPVSLFASLSTVDSGLDRLGYLAARVFVGDIPVSSHRSGAVPSQPRLIDRGSIAPPLPRRMRRLLSD